MLVTRDHKSLSYTWNPTLNFIISPPIPSTESRNVIKFRHHWGRNYDELFHHPHVFFYGIVLTVDDVRHSVEMGGIDSRPAVRSAFFAV